jgi:hypothetical protein
MAGGEWQPWFSACCGPPLRTALEARRSAGRGHSESEPPSGEGRTCRLAVRRANLYLTAAKDCPERRSPDRRRAVCIAVPGRLESRPSEEPCRLFLRPAARPPADAPSGGREVPPEAAWAVGRAEADRPAGTPAGGRRTGVTKMSRQRRRAVSERKCRPGRSLSTFLQYTGWRARNLVTAAAGGARPAGLAGRLAADLPGESGARTGGAFAAGGAGACKPKNHELLSTNRLTGTG